MKIDETRQGDTVQLSVQGRVDTNTSPQLQNCILQGFQKGTNVIIDFDGVDYVSSSGLRALLIGQKTASSKGGSLKLVNVCDGVMKVFEMTGFAKMLDIKLKS